MIFHLSINSVNSIIRLFLEMWRYALGGMLVGTMLAFIAMKTNLLSIGKLGSAIKTLLLKKGWRLRPSTNSGNDTTKNLSERIFKDIDEVLRKYRPELKKEFGVQPNEVGDVYRMSEIPEDKAFGVIVWRRDGKGIFWQNLIIDKPENLLKLLLDRTKTTMNIIMKNMPKEEAMEILKKGLGVDIVDIVDLRRGVNPDTKDIPVV